MSPSVAHHQLSMSPQPIPQQYQPSMLGQQQQYQPQQNTRVPLSQMRPGQAPQVQEKKPSDPFANLVNF